MIITDSRTTPAAQTGQTKSEPRRHEGHDAKASNFNFVVLVVSAWLIFSAHADASDAGPAVPLNPQAALMAEVKFDQRLGEQVDLRLSFIDEDGSSVKLADFVRDRPVVLVLAYYRCPMLCNQVLRGAVKAIDASGLRGGQDYEVVVVSFDPNDTPREAAELKKTILSRSGDDAKGGWHLLTGGGENSGQLAEQVGFQFRYDERSGQYAHAAGLVLLAPTGEISRYFYGIDFPPRDLRLGLVEASQNKIGNRVDQILLYCFHYDPLTGRYGLAIMNALRIFGVGFVLALLGYIAITVRRERKSMQME
ncbi:MAG: SCO family protein [Pirellulales bacterium]